MTEFGSPEPESPVSVIVVSYNTREKLRRCLSCIEPEHEVIVVDNASSDGSADMVLSEFPHAKLIRNTENRGFGAANNQGLDVMTRELALFLNSDCYASPGAIACLAKAFDSEPGSQPAAVRRFRPIVAAGGKLLNSDGSLQDNVAGNLTLWRVLWEQLNLDRFGPFRYWHTAEFELASIKHRSPVTVVQVMGACLMIQPVERFDERFFLYCEDTELCHRLRKHGQIVYTPQAIFTHDLGSSSTQNRWKSVALYNRGKELYFSIHKGRLQAGTCWVLNRFGALVRLLAWTIASILTLFQSRTTTSKVALFARVLTAPVNGPRTN